MISCESPDSKPRNQRVIKRKRFGSLIERINRHYSRIESTLDKVDQSNHRIKQYLKKGA